MEIFDKNKQTIKRNLWFIKLRWLAIAGISTGLLFAYIFSLNVYYPGIISIIAALIFHNIISTSAIKWKANKPRFEYLKQLMFIQIIIDLIVLTFLLLFSGGFENPLILFFTFHIVLSSILLSKQLSYFVATISNLLFLGIFLIERYELLPHYSLELFDYSSINLSFKITLFFIYMFTSYFLVYLVSDISEKLNNRETKLMNMNKELERKDRVKDEYVQRLTHDIKGHLGAIQTNLDVLKKGIVGDLDQKQMKFVDISYNRTLKVAEFVRNTLKLTQLRLNKSLSLKEINISDIIKDVVKNVKANADKKNIKVEYDAEEGITAMGDSFSIEEVISNLCLNSVKYTAEKGEIKVSAEKLIGKVKISIADNGIGIPVNEQDKIFNEFYRASNAKSNTKDGNGVGLSLVKQIIDDHKGEIWVESEENKGSKFIFTLKAK